MPCQLQWAARDALAFLNRKAFTRLRALFSFLRLVLHRISMAPGATRRADAATGAAAGGSCAGRTNARAAHAITRTSSDKRRAMAGQRLGPALGQRAQWGGHFICLVSSQAASRPLALPSLQVLPPPRPPGPGRQNTQQTPGPSVRGSTLLQCEWSSLASQLSGVFG